MNDTEPETTELARKAVSLYNRLKGPEVTAKLVFASVDAIAISFSGGVCYGCGVMDYVEGFAGQFKALSGRLELKIARTRQISPRSFEVDYVVKACDASKGLV